MSSPREVLADYLRIRRQLGFELARAGRELEDFVSFLEQAHAERITTELALMWAKRPRDATRTTGACGWGWCAASRATWPQSTLRARCRRRICCPRAWSVWRRTSTPRTRSRRSWLQRGA
jgi:hypothetical protein